MKEKRALKWLRTLFSLFILTSSGLLLQEVRPSASPALSQLQSECVQCHTNVKKLIRLSWEVEKIKPKQKKSAQTSGEG